MCKKIFCLDKIFVHQQEGIGNISEAELLQSLGWPKGKLRGSLLRKLQEFTMVFTRMKTVNF